MTSRRRSGFTLIELLTVIAVIGLLAAVLFPAVAGVRKKAKQATAQATFSQWANGVTRYRQVYGFYPNIGASYSTGSDSLYQLELGFGTNFIKSLSAKTPTGAVLSGGPTGDRAKFNRNAEEFCAFARDDFEVDPSGTGQTDATLLVDRFGNHNIRVIFDTDSSENIKGVPPPASSGGVWPDDLAAIATTGIPARVIIYTTIAGNGSDIGVINEGAPNPNEYADVIAIQ
jgi:prepilin-type N-terminal cleavage/methylation domain-containing protein